MSTSGDRDCRAERAVRQSGLRTFHPSAKGTLPPDYARVVRSLTDDELRAELGSLERRAEGYADAVRAEAERRGIR